MTKHDVLEWLSQFDLDLRKSKDGTALDMKDTPDVVSFIADCIIHYVDEQVDNGKLLSEVEFTVNTIWHTEYAINMAVQIFGKPSPGSRSAIQEYNKFFTLPIKALAYARILQHRKDGRSYLFHVENYDLLDYIAARDNNAAIFLGEYFRKVLQDSGMYDYFDAFLSKQTSDSLATARTAYCEFMLHYGLKGQKGGKDLESSKTFIKLINILAYNERKCGIARGGGVTEATISLQHIRYNERNSRDVATGKPKGVTRTDHEVSPEAQARLDYAISRAKSRVSKYNVAFNGGMTETVPSVVRGRKPGCIDMRFEQTATRQIATDKHHIFPAAEFPKISTYYENIICITPEQHYTWAHPDHDTHSINQLYQYYLVLSKMEQIMLNIQDNVGTPGFYSFRKFTEVLDTGLSTDEFGQVPNNDFDRVSDLIDHYY